MQVTAVLIPVPESGYTAPNPETGTTSEGERFEQATDDLREAVSLYLDKFPPELAPPRA